MHRPYHLKDHPTTLFIDDDSGQMHTIHVLPDRSTRRSRHQVVPPRPRPGSCRGGNNEPPHDARNGPTERCRAPPVAAWSLAALVTCTVPARRWPRLHPWERMGCAGVGSPLPSKAGAEPWIDVHSLEPAPSLFNDLRVGRCAPGNKIHAKARRRGAQPGPGGWLRDRPSHWPPREVPGPTNHGEGSCRPTPPCPTANLRSTDGQPEGPHATWRLPQRRGAAVRSSRRW